MREGRKASDGGRFRESCGGASARTTYCQQCWNQRDYCPAKTSEALDARRGELLGRRSGQKDLRFYLEAFIGPLAEQLSPREEGNFYIRFIQQYERYRGDYEFVRQISPHGVEIYAGLERLLYYLPDAVRRFRIGSLINVIHSILAAAEERLGRGELAHDEVGLVVANMLDMIEGGLTAPLSVETVDRLAAER